MVVGEGERGGRGGVNGYGNSGSGGSRENVLSTVQSRNYLRCVEARASVAGSNSAR